MKKLLFIIIIACFGSYSFAQLSNLIVFSEQGEKFYLILNGIKQNAEPETNVKVSDLNADSYKLKLIFEDKTIPDLDKTIYFQTRGNEYTFNVKQNKKGAYVLRYVSEVPVAQAPPPPPEQTAIVYTTTPPPPQSGTNISVTQTTSSSTTTAGNPDGISMGVNINDPDLGVNVNMNIGSGNTTTTGTQVSYSETTTTTTSTSGGGVVTEAPVVYVPGYSGPVGCPVPMDPGTFSTAKSSIMTKTFEDDKLIVAKQVVNSNCLLAAQVKELVLLFDFEDTKLEFAKYAYNHTYDVGNYFVVNDAFEFDSSIEELNNYIMQNPK